MAWVRLLGQLSDAEANLAFRDANAGPKGPHASEASDEPRSGEEPVPEATP